NASRLKSFNLSSNSTYKNYTAFTIDKVPFRINNSENIFSDEDYLLSEASLQLKGIVKQLGRSKNFRPLLHFGWRQKTKTKELAIPLKLFAGENFGYNYEQELKKFQQQLLQAKAQKDFLNKALYSDTTVVEELSEEILKQQALAERLQELIVKLPNLPTKTSHLLNEVNKDIAITNTMLNSTNMLEAPIKPPQDWTLDGFLKVEVDFYLHITADFNVMNMSLAQRATQQLLPVSNDQEPAQLKTINFKQDRRVRSKEIHYFDHPYMGMIIRILPHKKPIEEVEDTQESTSLN
ncbi:MAG: CsiV family protein, partial [Colwellia sp.]